MQSIFLVLTLQSQQQKTMCIDRLIVPAQMSLLVPDAVSQSFCSAYLGLAQVLVCSRSMHLAYICTWLLNHTQRLMQCSGISSDCALSWWYCALWYKVTSIEMPIFMVASNALQAAEASPTQVRGISLSGVRHCPLCRFSSAFRA